MSVEGNDDTERKQSMKEDRPHGLEIYEGLGRTQNKIRVPSRKSRGRQLQRASSLAH